MSYGPGGPTPYGRRRAPQVQLPPGLRVAGMAARIGAWLLDLVLLLLLALLPATIALVSGAVTFDAEAVRQMEQNPPLYPTVPLLHVQLGPVIFCAVLWVALIVVGGAVSWTLRRGTPGQRIASLQVADSATGRNLTFARAGIRSIVLFGIPAAASAVVAVATCQVLTVMVPADFQRLGAGNAALETYGIGGAWVGLISLASLVVWSWPLLLLVSTFSRDRVGLHDRLAGSVVVARDPVPSKWSQPYSVPVPPANVPSVAGDGTPGIAPAGEPAPNWPGVLPPGQGVPWSSTPSSAPPPGGGAAPGWVASPAETSLSGRKGPLASKLPEEVRIARFNRRLGAYGIDCAIILMIFVFVAAAVEGPASATPPSERLAMIAGFIGGVLQLVYFVASWSLLGGSIGQKLGGLRVVNESNGRLGIVDALARWAVLQGPFALFTASPTAIGQLFAIGAIMWAVLGVYKTRDDPDGQGYHDRVAHSLVVEAA